MFGEINYKAQEAFVIKGPRKEDGNAVTFGTANLIVFSSPFLATRVNSGWFILKAALT